MMKHLILFAKIIFVSSLSLGLFGCSDNEPPEKTTIEKLNSDNPDVQQQGLDEADQKYGDNG